MNLCSAQEVLSQVLQHTTTFKVRELIEEERLVKGFKVHSVDYDGKLAEESAPPAAFFEVSPSTQGEISFLSYYPKTAKSGINNIVGVVNGHDLPQWKTESSGLQKA